jgi:nucleoside triphosphate pyrophosphatase
MRSKPPAASSDLILASASPRRAEFLRRIGVSYEIVAAQIDEAVAPDEAPAMYVRRIALAKAATVSDLPGCDAPVLGADTAVVIDERILGKPLAADDARQMLERLSGRWHEVYSGVALVHRRAEVIAVRTRVKFRPVAEHEIDAYWASGEPRDKAGGYAIQGIGGAFVERIDGSYSNVVGLPLAETLALLDKFGVDHVLAR